MPGAENRLSHYKNKGRSGEELRKKRTEVSVELRKKVWSGFFLKYWIIFSLSFQGSPSVHDNNLHDSISKLQSYSVTVTLVIIFQGRDDQLLKRRNIALEDDQENDQNENDVNAPNFQGGGKQLPSLEEIVQGGSVVKLHLCSNIESFILAT